MAKILNLTGIPQLLHSKDGDSCLIPTGESKVADKFCVNVPPRVKILEIKKPMITKIVTDTSKTGSAIEKEIKSSKKVSKVVEEDI